MLPYKNNKELPKLLQNSIAAQYHVLIIDSRPNKSYFDNRIFWKLFVVELTPVAKELLVAMATVKFLKWKFHFSLYFVRVVLQWKNYDDSYVSCWDHFFDQGQSLSKGSCFYMEPLQLHYSSQMDILLFVTALGRFYCTK